MSKFALIGRQPNAYPERYTSKEVRKMYAAGVAAGLAGDLLSVFRCLQNGDLLGYDGERTRTLTDKIVAARAAMGAQS